MTFPTIPTVAGGRVLFALNTNPAGTHTSPNLSSLTKNNGDLLIAIIIIYDGNSTNAEFSSWGGSFTEFKDQATTTTMGIGCAYKVSTGSETGTFTVTSADTSANDSCFILLSIPGAHTSTAPEAGDIANGTSAAADPASFNPSGWDAEDTLWIAVAGSGETSTTGSYTGIASAPTNYTDYADSGISADVVGGVEGAVAFRQLNAASEDVGGFSVDTSNARNSALLIAVRPAPPAATEFTPNPVAAVLAVPAPTFELSLAFTPAPVAAVAAVPSPTIATPLAFTPSPVAAVLTVPAPAVTYDQAFTPSPVAAILAVPAPNFNTSLAFAPAPVAAVAAVPTPTLATPLAFTPAPVAAALAVPNPTLEKILALTPSPIATVLTVTAPTLATLYTIQPAPIAIILTVPPPGELQIGDIYFTPAPVAVTLDVPRPVLWGAPMTGSDLQLVLDCITFWITYDALTDEDEKRLLWENFLTAHGLNLRLRKTGFFPPRIPQSEFGA